MIFNSVDSRFRCGLVAVPTRPRDQGQAGVRVSQGKTGHSEQCIVMSFACRRSPTSPPDRVTQQLRVEANSATAAAAAATSMIMYQGSYFFASKEAAAAAAGQIRAFFVTTTTEAAAAAVAAIMMAAYCFAISFK